MIHALRESGRVPLSHVDLYRLENDDEVESIGFEEYYESSITVIEWADRYSAFEPPYVELHFEYGVNGNERRISVFPCGGDWTERLNSVC